jgi:hypothetical protein
MLCEPWEDCAGRLEGAGTAELYTPGRDSVDERPKPGMERLGSVLPPWAWDGN